MTLNALARARTSAGPSIGAVARRSPSRRPLGGVRQAFDRPGDATREDRADEQRGDRGDEGRDDEDARDALREHLANVLRGLAGGCHEVGKGLRANLHHAECQHDQDHGDHDQRRGDDPRRDAVRPHRELHHAPPARRRSTRPAAR